MLPEELGDTTFFHLGDNKREQAIAEWFRPIGKKIENHSFKFFILTSFFLPTSRHQH